MAHAFYEFLKKNGLEKVLLALSLDGENKNTGTDKPSNIAILLKIIKDNQNIDNILIIKNNI